MPSLKRCIMSSRGMLTGRRFVRRPSSPISSSLFRSCGCLRRMRSSASSKFGGSYTEALMLLFLGVVSSGRFFFLPNTLEFRCLVCLPLSEWLMPASSVSSVSTVTPTADARSSASAGIEGRPSSSSAEAEGKPGKLPIDKPGNLPINEFEGGSSPSRASWEPNARRRNAMVKVQRAARDCASGPRAKTRSERRCAQRLCRGRDSLSTVGTS